jgi:hypothetical protein
MRRITWSLLLVLTLAALGAGCRKQVDPKSDAVAPLPTSGPKGLNLKSESLRPPVPGRG